MWIKPIKTLTRTKQYYDVIKRWIWRIWCLKESHINARAYISLFNFSGSDQGKEMSGVLSGGERNRLHFAIALKEGGNVLLLR